VPGVVVGEGEEVIDAEAVVLFDAVVEAAAESLEEEVCRRSRATPKLRGGLRSGTTSLAAVAVLFAKFSGIETGHNWNS
jgi:hypothetical protein